MTRAVAITIALAACGPRIAVDDAETSTTTTSDGTTTAVATTTRGIDPPTTTRHVATDEDGGLVTTGATDEGTSTGGVDDDGAAFLGAPDGGNRFGECDLYAQNCPPGEKCMPWADDGGPGWNATRCSPLAPDPNQAGDACMVEGSGVSGIDDCDVGLMCWNIDENGQGVCEDMCTGSVEDPLCENPGDVCFASNDGVIALCLGGCHPLADECPIALGACGPYELHWICTPAWNWREGGAYGDPCDYPGGCNVGNMCVVAAGFSDCVGAFGCCTPLCDLFDEASDAMCQALDPAQTCEPWYAEGQAPLGYENVGVCMIAGAP